MLLTPPKECEIEFNDLRLVRLKCDPKYENIFIKNTTISIKDTYDEITKDFARNLVKVDRLGYDPVGYFTIGKEVWLAFTKSGSDFVGCEVVTRKRGGCIKIGPTYIGPNMRGRGYAEQMINALCRSYRAVGARKMYVTVPLNNAPTAVLDFQKLRLRMEALLSRHYHTKSSERVCGKFLEDSRDVESSTPPRLELSLANNTSANASIEINNLQTELPLSLLSNFIRTNMSHYYDDIDDDFVRALVHGTEESPKVYEKKAKILLTIVHDTTKLAGVAALTPKRGGSLKISPLIIDHKVVCKKVLGDLLDMIMLQARRMSRRKITIILPVSCIAMIDAILAHGYVSEGILREPYKRSVDMVVLSKFLQEDVGVLD